MHRDCENGGLLSDFLDDHRVSFPIAELRRNGTQAAAALCHAGQNE
jgi:hypothetical protein